MTDVRQWLDSIGLGQYGDAFERNAIELEHLPDLDHEVLLSMGVTAAGHRMTILKARAELDAPSGPKSMTGPALHPAATTGDAERRQLTVMFCDLVDSTALADRLDPEEYRELLAVYQSSAQQAIQRYDGYVARYMGDGLLVYFGYPHAHEEDPDRAVRAGLDIVAALGALELRAGIRLSARIGIATGLVVVGDIVGEGASEERAVLGSTPNLAARLQSMAAPDTVVMAESTARLVEGRFEVQSLGVRAVKGIAEPVTVYRILGVAEQRRFEPSVSRSMTPLTGRQEEIALLVRRWRQAEGGDGQTVLLAGEAGLGKSRILAELLDRLRGAVRTRILYYCSPYHRNSPLYPVIDQLEHVARFEREEPPASKLAKLEAIVAPLGLVREEIVPYLASLASIPGAEGEMELSLEPREVKRRTLDALVRVLLAIAAQNPVLLLAEDLHWADPSTLELLGSIIERTRSARVLAVLTFRPEFEPPWDAQTNLTWLRLNHLTNTERRLVVRCVPGGSELSEALVEEIAAKSDGVPLFIEELTKSLLDATPSHDGAGRVEGGSTSTPAPEWIPSTLRDALMARLDRLGHVKEVAQLAAMFGRRFQSDLLDAVSPLSTSELGDALARLIEAGLVFRREVRSEAVYEFKHALIQEIAYESLLKRTRRDYHRRIADALRTRRPNLAETEPELLAHHYARAGLSDEALEHWSKAGQRAMENSAYSEAVAYYDKARDTLADLPAESARSERALRLLVQRASAVMLAQGFGSREARAAYDEARTLCGELGDPPHAIFQVLRGIYTDHWTRGELDRAQRVASEILHHAESQGNRAMLAYAHMRLGMSLWVQGRLVEAQERFEQSVDLYDAGVEWAAAKGFGEEPKAMATAQSSVTLCLLGYPERSLASIQESIRHAENLGGYAASLCTALLYGGVAHYVRGDCEMLRAAMERLLSLRKRYGIAGYSSSTGLLGVAMIRAGNADEGMSKLREALAELSKRRVVSFSPCLLGVLAEALAAAGQPQRALETIAEGLDLVARTGQRWIEPELRRIEGDLMLGRDGQSAATGVEARYGESLRIARDMSARWWELKTATSLARLYRDRGDRRQARNVLAGVYGWFREGFDTPDLQSARGLLDELT